MARYRCTLLVLNAACFYLLSLMADVRPLVVVSLSKLVASLVLACLLAFVVVHSVNICRLLTTCLRPLPVCFFPLTVESSIRRSTADDYLSFTEPSLRPLFQRPPPVLSL